MPRTFLNQPKRPGRWFNNPLDYDTALSQEMFERIACAARNLDKHQIEILRMFARGQDVLSENAKLLMQLVGPDLMARSIGQACSVPPSHRSVVPALLAWSLNQPWATDIGQHTFSAWVTFCVHSRNAADTLVAANLFMAQLLSLLPCIPNELRASTVAHVLCALYRTFTPWTNFEHDAQSPLHDALSAHYLEVSHALIQTCDTQEHHGVDALHTLWCDHTILALDAAHRNGSTQLSQWLACSPLPLQDKIRILSSASACAWACPEVARILLPTLPANERERFDNIPWEITMPDKARINQVLVQTYCPQMYVLIALVVRGADWLDRQSVVHWVNRMGGIPDALLDLPEGFA